MSRLFLPVLLAMLASILTVGVASADAPVACSFWGTVQLDGTDVAGGTLVTAVIQGDEYHTHTPTADSSAQYFITIRPPEGKTYPDGTKVTFKVRGHNTGQTASFKAGANVRLDLTASTAFTTSTLSPSRITLVSVLLLALLAASYYLLVRRRGLRIAHWLGIRSNARRGEALPLAMDREDRPKSRYIWDNAKLTWVKNTIPVKSKPPTKQAAIGGVRADVSLAADSAIARQIAQDTSVAVDAQRKAIAEKQVWPIAVEDAGQPTNRYVWDGTKLGWVENTEPTVLESVIKVPAGAKPDASSPIPKLTVTCPPTSVGRASPQTLNRTIAVEALKKGDAKKQAVPAVGKEVEDRQKSPELYKGIVELIVVSPSESFELMRRFSRRLRHLKQSHQFDIMGIQTVGSQCFNIQLFLQRPIPLMQILESLEEVDAVSDEPRKIRRMSPALNTISRPNARIIAVRVKG